MAGEPKHVHGGPQPGYHGSQSPSQGMLFTQSPAPGATQTHVLVVMVPLAGLESEGE
jgi:hypothetical protein